MAGALSRQILYKKQNDAIQKEEPLADLSKSSKICDWLISHTLINNSALCRELGVNPANFYRYIKMNEIPEKFISPLVKILSNYGYK